jgi:serine/threonine protein kinase
MKKLSGCPHVIGYHGSYEVQREGYLYGYILMELAEKTVYDLLADLQKKGKSLSEGEILKILKDTVLGLK